MNAQIGPTYISALLWIFAPVGVALIIAFVAASLNTRFGYGAYSDLEKAIIRGWKKGGHRK